MVEEGSTGIEERREKESVKKILAEIVWSGEDWR